MSKPKRAELKAKQKRFEKAQRLAHQKAQDAARKAALGRDGETIARADEASTRAPEGRGGASLGGSG